MLNPNPGLLIWTIFTFVLLAIILRKFAWKPILEGLQRREEGVRSAIERAEEAKRESERLLGEHRKRLAEAEHEGRRLLGESRALADKLKSDIVDQANTQSRRMIEQAKQEIERDKDAALARLRDEVAGLAIGAAGRILDETLDEQKHRRIVDAYMRDLPAGRG